MCATLGQLAAQPARLDRDVPGCCGGAAPTLDLGTRNPHAVNGDRVAEIDALLRASSDRQAGASDEQRDQYDDAGTHRLLDRRRGAPPLGARTALFFR
jgi:hypothetical protein